MNNVRKSISENQCCKELGPSHIEDMEMTREAEQGTRWTGEEVSIYFVAMEAIETDVKKYIIINGAYASKVALT